jgi:hypothetical protein
MSSPAHSLSSAAPAMRFARNTVVSAWFIVFALFALSGSGTRSASGLLLFAGGLMALAMIAPMRWTLRRAPEPASRRDEGPVGSTDEHDLVRMDSDKG